MADLGTSKSVFYPSPHRCPHLSLSFIDYTSCHCDQPHLFCVSAQFLLATYVFLPFPPTFVLVAVILPVAHFFPPSSPPPSPLHHPSLPPSLNPVELVFPPSSPSVLQSTCDTLRSHSDSLGFTPNMLPRHPTLGNFEEFAC